MQLNGQPLALSDIAAVALGFLVPMLACLYGAVRGGRPLSNTFGTSVDSLAKALAARTQRG